MRLSKPEKAAWMIAKGGDAHGCSCGNATARISSECIQTRDPFTAWPHSAVNYSWKTVSATLPLVSWLLIRAQATSTQAPPTSLILLSASLLKNLALTTTGCSGRTPLPSTLK